MRNLEKEVMVALFSKQEERSNTMSFMARGLGMVMVVEGLDLLETGQSQEAIVKVE